MFSFDFLFQPNLFHLIMDELNHGLLIIRELKVLRFDILTSYSSMRSFLSFLRSASMLNPQPFVTLPAKYH
jgi:hypothetical protein